MSFPLNEQHFFIDGPAGKLEVKSVISEDFLDNSRSKTEDFLNVSKSKNAFQKVGIICHPHPLYEGSMDNKVVTTIARAWQSLGVATLRFNFRGVGKSEGKYGETEGELADLLAVQAWLESKTPHCPLWLSGFSFGSYISAKAASFLQQKVQALLSVAPPVHHFDFESLTIPSCPWRIVQGDQDEVVPFNSVLDWYEKLKLKNEDVILKVMSGASHFFHGRLIELKAEIVELMKDL